MKISLSSGQLKVVGGILRWAGVVGYAVAAVVGYFVLCHRQVPSSEVTYESGRVLPAGSRLDMGNFRYGRHVRPRDRIQLKSPAELVGKYIRYDRWPGDPIRPDDVTPLPLVKIAAGTLAYAFTLGDQADLVGALNTGSRVALYGGTPPIENVRVASVVCSAAPTAKCSAILELSKSQLASLTAANPTAYRLALHADGVMIEDGYRVVRRDSEGAP